MKKKFFGQPCLVRHCVSALSQNPVAAFPVGSKSRRSKSIQVSKSRPQNPFDLKIPSLKIPSFSKSRRSKSIRSQNPVAQNPFVLKIPSLKIHSFSKSRRSKSIRSQNPVAQNPFDLKIPSLKIHSVSESRRSKSIRSQNPVYPKSISFQNTIAKNQLFWVQNPVAQKYACSVFEIQPSKSHFTQLNKDWKI